MPSLGRLVRRLRPTLPHRPSRPSRPSRPLLPRPRGEYANDGFPLEHPRSVREPMDSKEPDREG
ncbi:hypothetical protein [Streptomyces sp. 6N223]|uniref:hypothetical protein n=1 Tax=Streptomyces sp. 6N223 TaxID=3457412 RepID=UPI003FD24502